MMSFSEMTVRQFVDAVASPAPTPGGGSAAAMTGAMGAALLLMVTGLSKSRHGTDEDRQALTLASESLVPLVDGLRLAADEDAVAFDTVMAAFRLPKATDAEKAARKAGVQEAYRQATDVPLQTLGLAARALEHAETVGRHGNPAAASDVGVAVGLLLSAAEGATANVRINLTSVTDEAYRADAGARTTSLLAQASDAAARARRALEADRPA